LFIKSHLCGIRVAYPEGCGGGSGKLIHGLSDGRSQGSHYSAQKKRIADGVAYLQSIARPDCKPLIMVATSPGFVERADEPRFVSKFVNYLRKVYRLQNYLWVREYTGAGMPHFHFVVMIPLGKNSYTLGGAKFNPARQQA
jgi:hypothetical protein